MTAERGERDGPQRGVRTKSGHSQPGLQSPVSLGPILSQQKHINTQQQQTVNSDNIMDLQIKENDDKEAGKMNYGTNFNNFIKVRVS